jgi:hypothetical protein
MRSPAACPVISANEANWAPAQELHANTIANPSNAFFMIPSVEVRCA